MTSKLVESRLPCPSCPSSDAYHLYDDGHGYCFSCGFHSRKKDHSLNYTYEYLPWRNVSKETMRFYDVLTKIDEEGKPLQLGYRYSNGSIKVRLLDKKGFHWSKDAPPPTPGLFGRDKFAAGSHKYVTVTEGELDALSLYEVLHAPVVSVQSASSAGADCSVDRSWLNTFERVYLAFDADAPGREAAANVAKLFDNNKVYDVKFTNRKDANEYLSHREYDELKNIWWNSKQYIPDNILNHFTDFEKILKEPPKFGVPYPFKQLTDMTYGIRTGEAVLITAQEKVGKTELVHFIEHKLLKENPDARVGALFLEEPKSRHLQALAGIELGRAVHLPDSGCTADQTIRALKMVVGEDDRLYLYSHFGSENPDVILDTVRYLVSACGCRYILLDHITMVVSGMAGEDERRTIDYLTTRLEMMVKELDFALICVSHVNDEGRTRGSRYPTKVFDITINVDRDLQSTNEELKRTWKLNVLFNRYCGKTGPAGEIVFDMDTYSYREKGNEAANDNSKEGVPQGVDKLHEGQRLLAA